MYDQWFYHTVLRNYLYNDHTCAIIYKLIVHFYNCLHTNYILVIRHSDDGHKSDGNVLFKNNNM
jgi:hypothetical protein